MERRDMEKNHFVLTHPDKPPTLIISIPDHKEVSRSLLKTELGKPASQLSNSVRLIMVVKRLLTPGP